MKKIINGRLYSTETAKEIYAWDNGFYGSFRYFSEALYQKKTGEFFIFGQGGAMSKYAQPCGENNWGYGERIIPVSESDARKWMEDHADADTYIEVFGEVEE